MESRLRVGTGAQAGACLDQALPRLRHLSMARSWYMGLPKDAEGLWQLTQLERLAFGACHSDEHEAPHLDLSKAGGMSNLTHLALSVHTTNSDSLSELTNLVVLDLTGASEKHVSNRFSCIFASRMYCSVSYLFQSGGTSGLHWGNFHYHDMLFADFLAVHHSFECWKVLLLLLMLPKLTFNRCSDC